MSWGLLPYKSYKAGYRIEINYEIFLKNNILGY